MVQTTTTIEAATNLRSSIDGKVHRATFRTTYVGGYKTKRIDLYCGASATGSSTLDRANCADCDAVANRLAALV